VIRVAVVMLVGCLSKPPLPDFGDPPLADGRFAAGVKHACYIDDAGRLACWGDNTFGQLGVASTLRASGTPIFVPGTWTSIAAGLGHTCGIRDGAVVCFGNSEVCQSGPCALEVPATAVPLPGGVAPVKVFAGGRATCAIGDDTGLYCWGNDDQHACALQLDGHAYCWGHAESLDLGSADGADHPVAAAVEVQHRFVALAVGPAASCGATVAHAIACWGAGFATQGSPSESSVVDPGPKWSGIAVGAGHVCGISDHHVRCYGLDDRGPLGDDFAARPMLADASVFDDAIDVVAGDGFTCARNTSAEVWCWGTNQFGELGNGEIASERAPVRVEGVTSATVLAAGANHTCALSAIGDVVCWGDNRFGQVLPGTALRFYPTPAPPALAQAQFRVIAGAHHTCARTVVVDEIDCWGDNRVGQLGGTTGRVVSDSQTIWTAMAAGGDATCAIDLNGTLECWGAVPTVAGAGPAPISGVFDTVALGSGFAVVEIGSVGVSSGIAEFANPGADCSLADGTPATMVMFREGLDNHQREVVASQLGLGHFCELDSVNFTLLACWGSNHFNQAAAPVGDCAMMPTALGAPNASGWPTVGTRTAPQIAVGGNRSCALTADGQLYCWGDNTDGLLGPQIHEITPPAPTLAVSGKWLTLAVGPSHTCAVDAADASVWCWGLNQFGEVGNGKRFHEVAQQTVPAISP
jgi:alpha-tubulin suppressor-like RCC1 family protein